VEGKEKKNVKPSPPTHHSVVRGLQKKRGVPSTEEKMLTSSPWKGKKELAEVARR